MEIVGGIIDVDAGRGSDGHSEIVAEAIEANALVAARGREHIDGDGGVGDGGGAKWEAVESAHNGKHEQSAGPDIAEKAYKEKEETESEHPASVETVDNKAAERAYKKCGHDIAR